MFNFSHSKEPSNFLLCGGSGSGKSFLTNEIIRDVLSTSAVQGPCPLNRRKSSNSEVTPKGKAQR